MFRSLLLSSQKGEGTRKAPGRKITGGPSQRQVRDEAPPPLHLRCITKNEPMHLSFMFLSWFSDFTEAPQKPAQRRESYTTEKQEVSVQHGTHSHRKLYGTCVCSSVLYFVFQRKCIEESVQRSSPTVSLPSATKTVPTRIETPAAPPASDKTPVQTQNDTVLSSSDSVSVTPSTTISKPPGQTAPVLPTEPNSHSSHPTQVLVSSSAPIRVTPVVPLAPVQAPASVSAPDASVKTTPSPVSISAPSLMPSPAVPVSALPPAPVQTTAPVLDTPQQSSTAPPTDGVNAPPTVQPTAVIHTVTTTAETPQAPPPATPNTSEPRPCESLQTPTSGIRLHA